MAARGSGVRRHGSARQNAEHDEGYSPNGMSAHSRQVAHANVRLGEGRRTDGRLLPETTRELARLEYRATLEQDPARLLKHAKNIAIKKTFLAKLTGQYADEHPNEPEPCGKVSERNWITNLPGDSDYEPWGQREGMSMCVAA